MESPAGARFLAMCLVASIVGFLATVYVVPGHSGWAMLAIALATLAVLSFVASYAAKN